MAEPLRDFLLETQVEDVAAIAAEHMTEEEKQRVIAEEHDRLRGAYPFGPVQVEKLAATATARLKREHGPPLRRRKK